MKNSTLIGIALVVAGLTLFGGSRSYILPDGRRAKESDLPDLGYVLYQGRWWLTSYLNTVMQQQKSSTDWQILINQGVELYNNGRSAWEEIIRIFGDKATLPTDDNFGIDESDLGGY